MGKYLLIKFNCYSRQKTEPHESILPMYSIGDRIIRGTKLSEYSVEVSKHAIKIHPKYLEGFEKFNKLTWEDKVYKLYDLALIPTVVKTTFGPVNIVLKKKVINRLK